MDLQDTGVFVYGGSPGREAGLPGNYGRNSKGDEDSELSVRHVSKDIRVEQSGKDNKELQENAEDGSDKREDGYP